MQQVDIYLEAESPLLIGSGLAIGNVQSSRLYVPGSVWRGAIARLMLDGVGQHKHSGRALADKSLDPTFAHLFLGDQATRFGFLYPVRKHLEQLRGTTTLPIPLTARTCKLNSGFSPKGHGVYDGVMNRLREAAASEELYSRGLHECPVCDGRIVRLRGVAARRQTEYKQMTVGKRSFVRVGLNRYTETAQERVLYVLDALVPSPEPLTFAGTWYGSQQQVNELRDLLKKYLLPASLGGYHLRIGTARARGMGQVRLRLVTGRRWASLEERLDKFQQRISGTQLEHLYAVLTLRSPLQLLDQHGFATAQVTSETLRAYHANVPTGLEVLRKYSVVEQEIWTGWSAAWGLPKPVAPAIAAGGVLIVRVPSRERDLLLKWLKVIEREGLGERRTEGWGDVLVCDPFHIKHDEG